MIRIPKWARASKKYLIHFDAIALAHEVIQGDNPIDHLHHQLEETIIATVALQQPMAHDLRRLVAALLITNELERMGDYAEGIGRTVLRRGEKSEIEIPLWVSEMRIRVSQIDR